ncbi:hypothetical protein SLA2020_150090 [Shorea laevis]
MMDFISKSIHILVNGEPYLIKVTEEEAPNGIFSLKSDHVFRELSDSDEASSESWSLEDEIEDEASVAISGEGEVNSSRNSSRGKKIEDDVEAAVEEMEEDVRDAQQLYRWTEERQNSIGAQTSAVNDIAFNAVGSQDKQQNNGDDKIQIYCTSNHEKSIADLETVSDNQTAQISRSKEGKSKWAADGPIGLSSPTEDDPIESNWTPSNHRPPKHDSPKSGGKAPIIVEVDKRIQKMGPISTNNESISNGSSLQKTQIEVRNRALPSEGHDAEQETSFWMGFRSESGEEREWMGRKQRKPKHRKKKKTRPCLAVYMEGRKEAQEHKSKERKNARKERNMEEKLPLFVPGTRNQVAGESITDSGIEKRNESLRSATDLRIAERIWAFAKEIGVGNHGNEPEVIQRLRDMEIRDREHHSTSKVSKVVLEGDEVARFK